MLYSSFIRKLIHKKSALIRTLPAILLVEFHCDFCRLVSVSPVRTFLNQAYGLLIQRLAKTFLDFNVEGTPFFVNKESQGNFAFDFCASIVRRVCQILFRYFLYCFMPVTGSGTTGPCKLSAFWEITASFNVSDFCNAPEAFFKSLMDTAEMAPCHNYLFLCAISCYYDFIQCCFIFTHGYKHILTGVCRYTNRIIANIMCS